MGREAAFEVTLNMPVERAWALMSDLTKPHLYVPGVYKCEFRTEQKRGVGASRRVYKKIMGFNLPLDESVVEWVEGSTIKLRLHDGDRDRPLPKSYFIYRIEPRGANATLFTGIMGYTFWGGALGQLIDAPLVYPVIRAQIRDVVLAIKHYYEQGTSPLPADIRRMRKELS